MKRSCRSPKNMDNNNKENLFTIEEDLDMSSFSKLRTAQKSSKRSGRCNLRKSLAWNNAFLTEEGVLDPIELSILTGSSKKLKENALSIANGHMSPLLGGHKSGSATPSNSVGQKFFGKMHSQSGSKSRKIFKDGNLLCKLDASNHKEQQEILVSISQVGPSDSGAISSDKKITKCVPRLAATSSIANTNAVIPPSKTPKLMPTKSYASSLPATPRYPIPALENKLTKATSTAHMGLNPDTKFVPSNMRKPLPPAQSFKASATDLSRPFVPLDKSTSGSKSTSASSVLEVVQGTTFPCSSSKGYSSLTKNADHVAGKAVAPVPEKPSALRMPSPSVGFFQQGKPPYATQTRRNVSQPQPTIPLIKKTNVKQGDEWRHLPSSTGQKSIKDPAAANSFGRATLSGKMDSSKGIVVRPSKNASTMQQDVNVRDSGESDTQISARQTLKRCHSEVDINFDNLPQVLSSKKPQRKRDKEVSHASSSILPLDKKPVNGIYSTEESLKVSLSGDACHPCPPTRKKCLSGLESSEKSCQTHCMAKPNETQINAGSSEVDSQVKQSSSEFTCLVDAAVSEEDGCSAGNLYMSRYEELGLSDRLADSSPLPINKSFLAFDKHSSWVAGCSLAGETVIEDDFGNDRTSVSLEEIKSPLRSNTDQSSGFGSISNSEKDGSQSQRTNVPAEEAHSRTNTSAVRSINYSEDSTVQFDKKDLINLKEESLPLNSGKNEQKGKVKQDIGHLKHQCDAAPFSEEWLAAIETFGEEILELKTGRVQNSPPDKTIPEPSPWSPVKRKTQDVGPFDCTKHATNLLS